MAVGMRKSGLIVAGDLVSLAIVILIGFGTHGETNVQFLPRMAAAYLPAVLAWFLLAPQFELFSEEITGSITQLWRPMFVLLFAGPLAAVLRGLVLNSPIPPIFVVVLTLTCGAGLTLWRLLYLLILKRKR